jgi:hypothetical protein
MILLKVLNEILYIEDYVKILSMFERHFKLKFNNITRFDICVDFCTFKNGLLPESLIKKYLSEKVVKSGKTKFYCIGSNHDTLKFDYLRFGSKTSVINTYLYNKSLEMSEVKTKPYIMDKWADLKGYNNTDVWRLEFSIKTPKMMLMDDNGSLEFKFTHYKDMELDNLYNLLPVLIDACYHYSHCWS